MPSTNLKRKQGVAKKLVASNLMGVKFWSAKILTLVLMPLPPPPPPAPSRSWTLSLLAPVVLVVAAVTVLKNKPT